MKKLISTIVLAFISSILPACLGGGSGCGQKITTQFFSPENSKVVIWVASDCGATTAPIGTTYLLSVSEFEKLDHQKIEIDNEFMVFSSERGHIEIFWASENRLEVLYDFTPVSGRKGQFISQNEKVDGVNILYKNSEN